MRFNTDPRLSFQLLLVCFFPLVLFAPACNDGKSGGSKALADIISFREMQDKINNRATND